MNIEHLYLPDYVSTDAPVWFSKTTIKARYPELYKEVCEKFEGLDIGWCEMFFLYTHQMEKPTGIFEGPDKPHGYCKFCGKPTSFYTFSSGYMDYCSPACVSRGTRDKSASTFQSHYGLEHPEERNELIERHTKTCRERFGVDHPSQCEEVMEKTRQTNLERHGCEYYNNHELYVKNCLDKYGVENISSLDSIKEKRKQTSQDKYGVDNPFQADCVKEKCQNTLFRNYGVTSPLKSPIIKEKLIQTNIERFGVENPFQSPEIREKVIRTNLEKFGVEIPMKNKDISTKSAKIRMDNFVQNSDFVNRIVGDEDPEHKGWWVCKCPDSECDYCYEKEYVISSNDYYNRLSAKSPLCTKLVPIGQSNISYIEKVVIGILNKNKIDFEYNKWCVIYVNDVVSNSTKRQLDFYFEKHIPYKLAIETNGIYIHSIDRDPKNEFAHSEKWNLCFDKQIELVYVWADWNVQDINDFVVAKYHNKDVTKFKELWFTDLDENTWPLDLGFPPGITFNTLDKSHVKRHYTKHGIFNCCDSGIYLNKLGVKPHCTESVS